MKIYPAIMTSLIASILISCGNSKQKKDVEKTNIPLIPEIMGSTYAKDIVSQDGKDTSVAAWKYEFYATPKNAWQDSVNDKIGSFVASFTDFNEEKQESQPLSHAYFAEKVNKFEKDCRETNEGSEYPMLWGLEGESRIDNNLKNYAQVVQSVYIFTGGAHPNTMFLNQMISKDDGRTVLLEEIVVDMGKFNKIAEKHFRTAREIGPEVDIAEEFPFFENGVFACNNNFFIDRNGISFTFNAYEIAAYAYGITEFTIPLNEIRDLISVELVFE